MNYWNLDNRFDANMLPRDLMQILERVHSASWFDNEATTTVRLMRLGRAGGFEGDADTCLYEMILEIAPGVEVVITDGSVDVGDFEDVDAIEADVASEAQDALLAAAERTLSAVMPQIDALSDAVHEARLMVRRILASMPEQGARASLSAVRLTSVEHWPQAGKPAFLIEIETIGKGLTTDISVFHVSNLQELRESIASECALFARRHARQQAMMTLGASGTIDQITLNAIDHFGNREETLRRFRSEWRFWLPDDTALVMDEGRVSSGNGALNMPIDWVGDWLTVERAHLKLDPALTIGRSVTDVVEHRFLSPDMIVTEAKWLHEDGRDAAVLTLRIPRKLFCHVSGRVWGGDPTPNGFDARRTT